LIVSTPSSIAILRSKDTQVHVVHAPLLSL